MSFAAVWARHREALVADLVDGMPVEEAGRVLENAMRGLARPYADEPGATAAQRAHATMVLESLGTASRRLLAAPVPRGSFDSRSGVRLTVARPGLLDGVVWLALIAVISLVLLVFSVRVLDPVASLGLVIVALLSTVGLVTTLARMRPPVTQFLAMFGAESVPWVLRLLFGLLGKMADAEERAERAGMPPLPKIVTSSHVDRRECLEWLREVAMLTDRLTAGLDAAVPKRRLWQWREGTTEVFQDLLAAAAREDTRRARAAAERLRTALLSEGIRVVEPDGANDALFEALPVVRGAAVTLRPALVDAADHRHVIALGQLSGKP